MNNQKTCERLNRDIQDNLESIAETQKEIDELQKYIERQQEEITRKNRAIQLSLVANPDSITCTGEFLVNGVLHKSYILHDREFVGFVSDKHFLSKSGILLWNFDSNRNIARFCLHIRDGRFLGSLEPHHITKVCPNWKSLEHLKVGESYGLQA